MQQIYPRLFDGTSKKEEEEKTAEESWGPERKYTGPCRVSDRGEEDISEYAQLFPDVLELQDADHKRSLFRRFLIALK